MCGRRSLVKFFGALIFLAFFAAGAEARKVQMAGATFSQSVLPMVVARDKGYFRDEDLDSHDRVGVEHGTHGRQRRFHLERSESETSGQTFTT